MGVGYIRQDVANDIADGKPASAAPLDAEFDGLAAFAAAGTGHTHDGTTGEGGPIGLTGPVQDFLHTSSAITPKTDDAYDLGSSTFEWRNLWVDGTANIDSLVSEAVTITGGTINGTIIGGTTPAAITGTTITAVNFVGPLTGSVTGDLVGNAATATILQTTRAITLSGDVTGTVNFNGSADATIVATIPSGSIETSQIADSNITTAKIANSAVTADKVATDAITTSKIANTNVTTAKIADSAITTAKVSDGSVTTPKIANDAVTADKLADNSVAEVNILNGSVTTSKLADSVVTTEKITDASVTLAKVAPAAIVTSSETVASNNNDVTLPTTAAVKSYVDSLVLGVGQTWQDVAASRNGGTSYQNTTGRPIMVALVGLSNSSSTVRFAEVSADNLNWVSVGRVEVDAPDRRNQISFVVPSGHFYRVDGSATFSLWAELR